MAFTGHKDSNSAMKYITLSAIKVNRLQELASEGLNAYDGNIH
jgi:hypothetical protein